MLNRLSFCVFAIFTIFGCGGLDMRRLSDVEFSRRELSVAANAQFAFQTGSGLSAIPAMASYAALASESGALSVVATLPSGCYILVGTSEAPLASIDVGATNLNGEMVNNSLERNDWYQTAGMAARGFCLTHAELVTLGSVTTVPRMAVLLSLYPVRDSNEIVAAISALQNAERRGMEQILSGIVSGLDSGAAVMPWAATLPNRLGARQEAVSGLPAGVTPGMCLFLAVTGSGGASRDVDLFVFTGDPPMSPGNLLALDDRINPNAAVAFTVPVDPNIVHVAVRSYTGGGPIWYAAYRVRNELCAPGVPPVPIPEPTGTANRSNGNK